MTIRALKPEDLEALAAVDQEPDELPRLDDPMTETAWIALDEKGAPIMACVAVKTIQMYLITAKDGKPFRNTRALRSLQANVSAILKGRGYREMVAFVSDPRFGRLLEQRFGWLQTKLSWMKGL